MATSIAAIVPHHRFPRAAVTFRRYGDAPARQLTELGQMVWFALTAVGLIPFALRRYHKELLQMLARRGWVAARWPWLVAPPRSSASSPCPRAHWSPSRASRRGAISVSRHSPDFWPQ